MLAGKIASARRRSRPPHKASTDAAPADLETALQLLYQEFRAPNDDPDAFALMKRQLEASVANRGQSPGQVFGEKWRGQHVESLHVPAADDGGRGDARSIKMLAFYRDRFSNAADFTFSWSARSRWIRRPAARPVRRLAAVHGHTEVELRGSRASTFPTSVQNVEVEKGREPKSQTVISFFADPSEDPMDQEKSSRRRRCSTRRCAMSCARI